MPRCASCGTQSPVEDGICLHHIATEANWAIANRIFCDLLHRRIEPPPVPSEEPVAYEVFALVGGD